MKLVSGDFYADELPSGCDLALLSAIIHQNDPARNVELYEKVFRALRPGGSLLIRDFVMDASHTRPAGGALFAVNMLVGTSGGSTYSFDEISAGLEKAGFSAHRANPRIGRHGQPWYRRKSRDRRPERYGRFYSRGRRCLNAAARLSPEASSFRPDAPTTNLPDRESTIFLYNGSFTCRRLSSLPTAVSDPPFDDFRYFAYSSSARIAASADGNSMTNIFTRSWPIRASAVRPLPKKPYPRRPDG